MALIRCTVLAISFLFAAANTLQAQKYKQGIHFNHITEQDGLSQSSGHDILQDSQGFMWFATNDGLNRYNGYEMTVYKERPDDSTSISGNNISVLFEDSGNNLWVGTSGDGLNLYNRNRDNFTRFQANYTDPAQSISDNSITSILEDGQGRLWIGTQNGLNLYDPEKGNFVHFYAPAQEQVQANSTQLSSSSITSLAKGRKGSIWIGTVNGLNRWNPKTGTFTHFMPKSDDPYSISSNQIQALHFDSQGTLWVGTAGSGLSYYNANADRFYHYTHDPDDANSLSGNAIFSLHEDSQGTLWVGTDNDGLNAFDREEQKFYQFHPEVSNPSTLTNKSIYSIYESSDQILWLGTFAGGINYFELQAPEFEHYKHNPFKEDQLSNNSVFSFLEDSRGNLWVGTDGGGLNLFDRQEQTFRAFQHNPDDANSPTNDVILALQEDKKGDVWIGYYEGGVSRFNPETMQFTHFRHEEGDTTSLSSDDVFVIHEDQVGNLWFGTNGQGINRLNRETGTFKTYLPNQTIRAIHDAGNGALWVGTYGGGLIYFDPKTGERRNYTVENANLSGNAVMVIHEDEQGVLWLGTRRGLTRFNPEKWTFDIYKTGDGLPSNTLKGIAEDGDGALWISTNQGISKFNPKTETFTNYGIVHGLQGNEFNQVAYYKDREGFIYFGGINGFNRFHPRNVIVDQSVPPVKITDLQILNESVSAGDNSLLETEISQATNLELRPYDASVITFEFSALNYKPVKDNNFAYKMEGFDSDWNYVGSKRSATYTNLDPGEYTFRVKTSNNDGIWNEGTTLAVTINPYFWQTYPFYILFGTIGGIFLLGLYQWKVLSVRRQNELLEQTVSERTEELHNRNDELKEALKELKKTRGELVEKAHKAGMADIATGVLHNVGNILNSINTSTAIINETLSNSRIQNLKQANEMLRPQIDDLENFILNNPKAKLLLEYYLKIEDPLQKEHDRLKTQAGRLNQKVDLIIDVIAAQQNFSKADIITEEINVRELFEDALTLQAGSIERHGLTIKRDYEQVDQVCIEKTKVMHILFNLLKNAKESMKEAEVEEKIITVRSWEDDQYVYLSVSDNGMGVDLENLNKIFTHGYTTKENGHGFGLHSSANYMKQMGGNIEVDSEGSGQGATFTLSFPKDRSSNSGNTRSRKNAKSSNQKVIELEE